MRAPGLLLAALTSLGSCKPAPPGDNSTTTSATTTATTTNSGASTTSGPDPTSLTPTSTTTDATSTSSTGTTADDFILQPDGGGPISECNGLQQLDSECRPGQKCTINGTLTMTHCVDIAREPRGLYEPCTVMGDGFSGHDDCDLGLLCWDVDEQGHGTCIGLCDGEFGDCVCADPITNVVYCQECAVGLCIPKCDPLLQDCMNSGLCIPNSDGTDFTCVVDASGDAGQTNDPCEFANSCDPGLACLDAASASSACALGSFGCCQPFCKFPNTPCPNPDQKCIQWFDPMQDIPPGMEDVGVCAIPS